MTKRVRLFSFFFFLSFLVIFSWPGNAMIEKDEKLGEEKKVSIEEVTEQQQRTALEQQGEKMGTDCPFSEKVFIPFNEEEEGEKLPQQESNKADNVSSSSQGEENNDEAEFLLDPTFLKEKILEVQNIKSFFSRTDEEWINRRTKEYLETLFYWKSEYQNYMRFFSETSKKGFPNREVREKLKTLVNESFEITKIIAARYSEYTAKDRQAKAYHEKVWDEAEAAHLTRMNNIGKSASQIEANANINGYELEKEPPLKTDGFFRDLKNQKEIVGKQIEETKKFVADIRDLKGIMALKDENSDSEIKKKKDQALKEIFQLGKLFLLSGELGKETYENATLLVEELANYADYELKKLKLRHQGAVNYLKDAPSSLSTAQLPFQVEVKVKEKRDEKLSALRQEALKQEEDLHQLKFEERSHSLEKLPSQLEVRSEALKKAPKDEYKTPSQKESQKYPAAFKEDFENNDEEYKQERPSFDNVGDIKGEFAYQMSAQDLFDTLSEELKVLQLLPEGWAQEKLTWNKNFEELARKWIGVSFKNFPQFKKNEIIEALQKGKIPFKIEGTDKQEVTNLKKLLHYLFLKSSERKEEQQPPVAQGKKPVTTESKKSEEQQKKTEEESKEGLPKKNNKKSKKKADQPLIPITLTEEELLAPLEEKAGGSKKQENKDNRLTFNQRVLGEEKTEKYLSQEEGITLSQEEIATIESKVRKNYEPISIIKFLGTNCYQYEAGVIARELLARKDYSQQLTAVQIKGIQDNNFDNKPVDFIPSKSDEKPARKGVLKFLKEVQEEVIKKFPEKAKELEGYNEGRIQNRIKAEIKAAIHSMKNQKKLLEEENNNNNGKQSGKSVPSSKAKKKKRDEKLSALRQEALKQEEEDLHQLKFEERSHSPEELPSQLEVRSEAPKDEYKTPTLKKEPFEPFDVVEFQGENLSAGDFKYKMPLADFVKELEKKLREEGLIPENIDLDIFHWERNLLKNFPEKYQEKAQEYLTKLLGRNPYKILSGAPVVEEIQNRVFNYKTKQKDSAELRRLKNIIRYLVNKEYNEGFKKKEIEPELKGQASGEEKKTKTTKGESKTETSKSEKALLTDLPITLSEARKKEISERITREKEEKTKKQIRGEHILVNLMTTDRILYGEKANRIGKEILYNNRNMSIKLPLQVKLVINSSNDVNYEPIDHDTFDVTEFKQAVREKVDEEYNEELIQKNIETTLNSSSYQQELKYDIQSAIEEAINEEITAERNAQELLNHFKKEEALTVSKRKTSNRKSLLSKTIF